jgi:hypothetical protein
MKTNKPNQKADNAKSGNTQRVGPGIFQPSVRVRLNAGRDVVRVIGGYRPPIGC